MIDVKQAIQIAKAKAAEILNLGPANLEEIERDSYKGIDVWSITLSIPRDTPPAHLGSLAMFSGDREYKRFLIDADSGELLAMKLREVAVR